MKLTSNPEHPYSRFSTGNLQNKSSTPSCFVIDNIIPGSIETLVDIPKKLNLDIREALLAYHHTYYSANLMTLVIIGKEPLDSLEAWAREYFVRVPNKNATRPSWPSSPLNPPYLKVICIIFMFLDLF
jgi:insulysin